MLRTLQRLHGQSVSIQRRARAVRLGTPALLVALLSFGPTSPAVADHPGTYGPAEPVLLATTYVSGTYYANGEEHTTTCGFGVSASHIDSPQYLKYSGAVACGHPVFRIYAAAQLRGRTSIGPVIHTASTYGPHDNQTSGVSSGTYTRYSSTQRQAVAGYYEVTMPPGGRWHGPLGNGCHLGGSQETLICNVLSAPFTTVPSAGLVGLDADVCETYDEGCQEGALGIPGDTADDYGDHAVDACAGSPGDENQVACIASHSGPGRYYVGNRGYCATLVGKNIRESRNFDGERSVSAGRHVYNSNRFCSDKTYGGVVSLYPKTLRGDNATRAVSAMGAPKYTLISISFSARTRYEQCEGDNPDTPEYFTFHKCLYNIATD